RLGGQARLAPPASHPRRGRRPPGPPRPAVTAAVPPEPACIRPDTAAQERRLPRPEPACIRPDTAAQERRLPGAEPACIRPDTAAEERRLPGAGRPAGTGVHLPGYGGGGTPVGSGAGR